MTLPDFLTRDEYGFVRIAGHRIGFHHVIRLYKAGRSAEDVAHEFPTLALPLIETVLAFCRENRADVEAYLAEEDAEYERLVAAHPPSPALLEIRRRLAAKGTRVPE